MISPKSIRLRTHLSDSSFITFVSPHNINTEPIRDIGDIMTAKQQPIIKAIKEIIRVDLLPI